MKKIVLVLALAVALSGCAGLQTAFHAATTPIAVTPQMVYDAENGMKVAMAGLVAYRRLCIQKAIDPVTRKCRDVIATIQPYTRAASTSLIQLRAALRANDQITALAAYKAMQGLLSDIQSERQKAGV